MKRVFLYRKILFCIAGILILSSRAGAQNFTRELYLAKERMNGEDVRLVQNKLISLGFTEVGDADGWFGPNTQKALSSYQEFIGFVPNGRVDKKLWNFMFSKDPRNAEVEKALRSLNSISLAGLKKEEEDLEGRSTEGGTITRYKEKNLTKYCVVDLCGEMGKVAYKIYHIPEGSVVIEEQYVYPAPFDIEHAKRTISAHYLTKTLSVTLEEGAYTEFTLAASTIDPEWLR